MLEDAASEEPWVLPGAGPAGRDAYVKDRPPAASRLLEAVRK